MSISETLVKMGHIVFWFYKTKIHNIQRLCKKIKPDQIWLSHSGLKIKKAIKKKIKIPVIGFGFSDPYGFSDSRLSSYDIYVTNNLDIYEKYKDMSPCIYNPTACYVKFHKRIPVEKDIDCSIIGCGKHIRFPDQEIRIKLIDGLREATNLKIMAFGPGWSNHPDNCCSVRGHTFLNVINRSKLGLDLQEDFAPLAHRVMEYGACGVPCITRRRPEAEKILQENKETLFYSSFEDLKEKVIYFINNKNVMETMSQNVFDTVRNEHDISNRLSHILSEIDRFCKNGVV